MNKQELQECEAIRDNILGILKEIRLQHEMILNKLDHLEIQQQRQTQKALLSGGLSGGIVSLGIEFLRAKFGG